MTMWTSNGDVESDPSDLPGIGLPNQRRRSRRRAWRDGLADQTVVRDVEDIRVYRALERLLIRSIDPRTAIELTLVHRLANLLWRLRRASAIETGLFEVQRESLLAQWQDSSRGQPRAVQNPARANGGSHSKVLSSNGPLNPTASDPEPFSTTVRPPFEPANRASASSLQKTNQCQQLAHG